MRHMGYALKIKQTETWLLSTSPTNNRAGVIVHPTRDMALAEAREFNTSRVSKRQGVTVEVHPFDGWNPRNVPNEATIRDIGPKDDA